MGPILNEWRKRRKDSSEVRIAGQVWPVKAEGVRKVADWAQRRLGLSFFASFFFL